MNPIIEKIRELFPALHQKSHNSPLVYLDNAATSQKPKGVLDLIANMNGKYNANVHRSMYELSDHVTELYEKARIDAADFIGAKGRENIIFTSGTTASVNLVAHSFGRIALKEGEKILVGADNHHSNIVPWQFAAQSTGAEIDVLPIEKSGEYDLSQLEKIIDGSVKIVALSHISNITGVIHNLAPVIEQAHKMGAVVLIDGAQGIVHEKVDVEEMDCDFYTFSTHKLYGATGHGVLFGKKELLEKMPPYLGGGDMVDTVTYQHTTFAHLPLKFEAGTPNFIGAATLTPAIEFVRAIRGEENMQLLENTSNKELSETIANEQRDIIEYMFESLENEVGDVEIYGKPNNLDKKISLFSFNIKGTNSSDIAQLLDQMGIAVRSGMMCAEPLLDFYGVRGAVRASFASYNTLEEAKLLIGALKKAKQLLL